MTSCVRWTLLTLAGLSWLSAGCTTYNTDCTGLVENPEEPIGYLAEDVPLERSYARHANNALGQLAADAMLHARTTSSASGDEGTELGVFNGGAIRDEGVCVTRERLPRGELTRGELHEVLLFSNVVTTLDLTGDELIAMFENSVSMLFPTGEVVVPPSGSGRFLQISEGSHLTVDCSLPVGDRVTGLQIGTRDVFLEDREAVYRVAISSFLLSGADGYTMLAGLGNDSSRNPRQAIEFGGTDAHLTAEYLSETYPISAGAAGGLRVEPRISFVGCASP